LPDKKEQKQKRYIYIALAVYWVILLIATSLPSPSLPDIKGGDKLHHFSAYFILTTLLAVTFLQANKPLFRKYAFILAVLTAAVYGLVDEIHQSLIPGRSCEFMDWVADLGGAVTGSLVVYFYIYFRRLKTRKG